MKSKVINAVILSTFLCLGGFFGFTNYKSINNNLQADSLFQEQLAKLSDEAKKSMADDINITNTNKQNNNNSSVSSSSDGTNEEVNFTDFYEMYGFALEKYNNATYIQTTCTNGTAMFSGTVNGSITFNNELLKIEYTKEKAFKEKQICFNIKGAIKNMSFNVKAVHYTNGNIAEYLNDPTFSKSSLTEKDYINRFNFKITDILHIPSQEIVNIIKPSDITLFYYDEISQTYIADLSINGKTFDSNVRNLFKAITDGAFELDITRINMKISVDKDGNFKSIDFSESINVKITDPVSKITVQGKMTTTYTENFKNINKKVITIKKLI